MILEIGPCVRGPDDSKYSLLALQILQPKKDARELGQGFQHSQSQTWLFGRVPVGIDAGVSRSSSLWMLQRNAANETPESWILSMDTQDFSEDSTYQNPPSTTSHILLRNT